jgi:hypothetical protein
MKFSNIKMINMIKIITINEFQNESILDFNNQTRRSIEHKTEQFSFFNLVFKIFKI